jgi:hypothetical protein
MDGEQAARGPERDAQGASDGAASLADRRLREALGTVEEARRLAQEELDREDDPAWAALGLLAFGSALNGCCQAPGCAWPASEP